MEQTAEQQEQPRQRRTNFLLRSREHKILWSLNILVRLEEMLQADKEKFAALGIEDLTSLLTKIKVSNRLAAVTGTEVIRQYQRAELIKITDPFSLDRDRLATQLKSLKREKSDLESTQLTTLAELEHAQATSKHLARKISETQKQLDSLPARNTIPDSLWNYPSIEDLVKQGFAVDKKPYPELTARGKSVIDLAYELRDRSYSILKRGGSVSDDLISSTWQHMRSVFTNG